jgi:urea transporter
MEWLRGILISAVLIGIGFVSYSTLVLYGEAAMLTSIACTFISLVAIACLIYAYENDSFEAGFAIPILLLAGIGLGYFFKPPIEGTLFSSFLGAIVGLLIVQEE